jgi:hypothetical protein
VGGVTDDGVIVQGVAMVARAFCVCGSGGWSARKCVAAWANR